MAAPKRTIPEPQPTPAPSILADAHQIIHGDREQTYGSPDKNLQVIADYWTIHLRAVGKLHENEDLTVSDVCGMMILLKQARLANNPQHRDSLVDIAGYAALQDICNTPQ